MIGTEVVKGLAGHCVHEPPQPPPPLVENRKEKRVKARVRVCERKRTRARDEERDRKIRYVARCDHVISRSYRNPETRRDAPRELLIDEAESHARVPSFVFALESNTREMT